MTMRLSQLLDAIAERSGLATISQARPDSEALRRHLRELLVQPPGLRGSFLGDPVIEAGFEWQRAGPSMEELAGKLLHPALIEALDHTDPVDPVRRNDRYRFACNWSPFSHQLSAWQALAETPARSVLVTSGTGSGKTECFLVPILDALIRQRATTRRLSGIQAIILYPLNALINSQRDRLTDWIAPLNGDLRYCLYNGETKEEVRAAEQRQQPWRVLSRRELRADPPPILVTNVTMLEYMLLRNIDAPILERSQGQLRWIVLDEAHSYVGSQAAELSLLIRRVLRAFAVNSNDVRFVATSATIGEGEDTRAKLESFMADVAGVSRNHVSVIEGRRDVVELPDDADGPLPQLGDRILNDWGEAGQALAANRRFRELRRYLSRRAMRLSEVTQCLFGSASSSDPDLRATALDLVDAAAHARFQGQRLLPLRLHLFHRAQPGLWACINARCPGRVGTLLDAPEWPYGCVLTEEAERCPACNSLALELVTCTECSLSVLVAEQTDNGVLQPRRAIDSGDEFSQDVDPPEADSEEEQNAAVADAETGRPCLLVAPMTQDAELVSVDRATARILDCASIDAIAAHLFQTPGCPRCRAMPTPYRREVFQPARFGAPFLLGNVIPQLLEAAPPRDGTALPFGGRQLITFTDSRQGTARFAAKLQQDAERNYVRSVLYHLVQETQPGPGSAEDAEKIRAQIAALEPSVASDPLIAEVRDALRKTLEQVVSPPDSTIAWMDAVRRLADRPETLEWVTDVWEARDSRYASPTELAEMLVLREFIRRPRKQNSAETMGLVALRWPAIDKLTAVDLPDPFAEQNLSISDWQDFLYVVVTYQIRANTAVAVDWDTLRWIGLPGRRRVFAGPESPSDRSHGILRWPLARHRGRYARSIYLLAHALAVDPSTLEGADRIDMCMETAWRQLQRLGSPDPQGLKLDLRRAHLAPLRQGWMCPITGRVLDRIFAGVTPYLPLVGQPLPVQAQSIEMPRFPFSWGRDQGDDASEEQIRDWLANDGAVEAARTRGAWRDLHDRIALAIPYFRVAEHSAQQSSETLQRYEEKFKKGLINILSCSTTMEMGVDIGGISTVVMTNVPPAPANYRQRVGRAGRRGEPRAISLTFCRDNPLGWTVYHQPTWPFEHAVRPPAVSLDSPIIVQRHVNALLLSAFLKRETQASGESAMKLRAGWFFSTKPEERNQSPAARFMAWCEAIEGFPDSVQTDLDVLVVHSCLDGHPSLRSETAVALEDVAEGWRREWDSLADAEGLLSGQDSGARSALRLQKMRFEQEYLLGELATRGFLPGYGFPTDVVPLVIDAPSKQELRRDDNRFTIRDYPSRRLDLAIRDYAPGSEVVLDGLVYESAGVTLNWQRPAGDDEVREIQALRHAWRCRSCGTTDTAFEMPELCSACGSGDVHSFPYLRPSGFAVDVRKKPHADITRVRFILPAAPWISARRGTWTSLPAPDLGRFRATRDGHVFHYTRGASGNGFALCLECGRAAEEEAPDAQRGPLPTTMRNHKPLRGARRSRAASDGVCTGINKSFAIRRNLMLGHDIRTDVFELQLFGLNDESVAMSLVIALREALGRQLGIEPQELGWLTVRAMGQGGRPCRSLMLYDRAAGGAGFAGQAMEDLPGLLRIAAAVLDCGNRTCASACHACILTPDSQFNADQLNRQAARRFLQQEILPHLQLPPERRYLGEESWPESRPLVEAIDIVMHMAGGGELTVWLGGDVNDWDLTMWSARPLLEKWGAHGNEPRIALPRDTLMLMSPEQKMGLARLGERCRGKLVSVEAPPRVGSGWRVADVRTAAGQRCWVVDEISLLIPDQGWGAPAEAPIVTGRSADMPPVTEQDTASLAGEMRRLVLPVEVAGELNGRIAGFGRRFWKHLLAKKPDAGQLIHAGLPIVSVTYEDRYLRSPLSVRLLAELLRPLAGAGKSIPVKVRTSAPDDRDRDPALLHHDWNSQKVRDVVLQSALSRIGFSPSLYVRPRINLPHDRRLVIEWRDGSRLRVGFDQGLGYWLTLRPVQFPFTSLEAAQVRTLLEVDTIVISPGGFSTIIYVYPLSYSDD